VRNGAGSSGQAAWAAIAPGYFKVLEVPLIDGRTFTDADTSSAPPVVIVDRAMARQFWTASEDPLGSQLVIGRDAAFANEPIRQVVGIVGAVYDGWANVDHAGPHMYVPLSQLPDAVNASIFGNGSVAWLIRTTGAPSSVGAFATEQLRQATGTGPITVRAMTDIVSASRSRARFDMVVMTTFGGVALLLAAIGLYGLISNVVEQQTKEMGIRKALGATPRQVESHLLRYGTMLLAIGIVAGALCASALTRLMAAFLFRVRPLDATVFMVIPVVLMLVGLCAAWIPARRTRKIDPLVALRAN
jgi:predicted lysophospholipase L1 biosynthesis ABC-type transport system permease subunit